MAENSTLSGNRRRALAALLASKNVRAAAAACNLSERTLWRYLAEDAFLSALQAEQAALYSAAGVRLANGLQAALDGLESLMTSAQSEAVRRQAVTDWLDRALKLRELLELEARITALEEKIK